ncbi:thioredoxin family protein [Shouchella patagoniensis]|uniref:thioredoxin family protein n=1 Tax=Shouchella patagoniensis TaxID=228576 RepID=UPI00147279F5|nr:thioredoxin family protein [Shouchella patagoniensis]
MDPLLVHSLDELETFLASHTTKAIYIYQENCSVCHGLWPQVQPLFEQTSIPLAKVDATEVKEIAGKFLVFTVPTIIVLKGKREEIRESRFIQVAKLEDDLRRLSK